MVDTSRSPAMRDLLTCLVVFPGFSPDLESAAAPQHVKLHHGSSLLLLANTSQLPDLHEHSLSSADSKPQCSGLLTTPGTSRPIEIPSLLRSLLETPTPGQTPYQNRNPCNTKSPAWLEQVDGLTQSCDAVILQDFHAVRVIGGRALIQETVNYVKSSLVQIASGLLKLPIQLRVFVGHAPHARERRTPGSKGLSGAPPLSKSTGRNTLKSDPTGKTPLRQENKFQLGVYDSNDKLKRAMFGCWAGKASACQPACDQAKQYWKLVRSLCRSKHLRDHAANGDISDLQLQHLKIKANQKTRQGDEDELWQEELWREYFIFLYPSYSDVRAQLNPYFGQPLLDSGRHVHVVDENAWQVAGGVSRNPDDESVVTESAVRRHDSAEAAQPTAYTTQPIWNAESSQASLAQNVLANATFALPFPATFHWSDGQAEDYARNEGAWQLTQASESYGWDPSHQQTRPSVQSADAQSPVYPWRVTNVGPGTESSTTTIETPSLTNGTEAGPLTWDGTALAVQTSHHDVPLTPLQEETLTGLEHGHMDHISNSDPSEMATEIADLAGAVTLREATTGDFTFDDGTEHGQPPFAFVKLRDIEGAKPGYR